MKLFEKICKTFVLATSEWLIICDSDRDWAEIIREIAEFRENPNPNSTPSQMRLNLFFNWHACAYSADQDSNEIHTWISIWRHHLCCDVIKESRMSYCFWPTFDIASWIWYQIAKKWVVASIVCRNHLIRSYKA